MGRPWPLLTNTRTSSHGVLTHLWTGHLEGLVSRGVVPPFCTVSWLGKVCVVTRAVLQGNRAKISDRAKETRLTSPEPTHAERLQQVPLSCALL